MKYADLHVHTYYSDSTFSPKQVIDIAHEKGIDVIGITDHDCFGGIDEACACAKEYNIEIVPGIEISAITDDDKEIHILGYYLDRKDEDFLKKLEIIYASRIERVYLVTKLLQEKGLDIEAQDIFNIVGKGTISRLHIARAIYEKGFVRSLGAAFKKYIGVNAPCYLPHMKISPQETIESILAAGGVPVIAHPITMNDDSLISELVDYGLKGIEVFHTNHSVSDEKKYKKIAKQFGLIMTGGSDCHGDAKRNVLLGSRLVQYEVVEQLKRASLNNV